MKHMKRCLCALLAALTLLGAFGVAASAAPAAAKSSTSALDKMINDSVRNVTAEIEKLLKMENVTEKDLKPLIDMLSIGSMFGIDFGKYLKNFDIPIPVKAMLHKAGVMKFPIYERSYVWNFIFKYLLFGWIWMPLVKRMR